MESLPPASAILIGAGVRGKTYAQYAVEHPDKFKLVGVAEPRKLHRDRVQARFEIPDSRTFSDWKDLVAQPRLADAVIISTQDTMHAEPAVACAKLGYHILLEKPMAVSTLDCKRIAEAAKEAGVILAVCHVLRYTPYMQRLVEIIQSGAIGDVVNVTHFEPIGSWHFAHSYVRGNWRREDESSFMLMTKCCHDIDLIRYMVGKRCLRVTSFGSNSHFKRSEKPAGATDRCLTCPVEGTCPFSAKRIYLQPSQDGYRSWPVSSLTDGPPEPEAIEEALRTGPYGRCVYECDNDVNDHQVVSMEFEGGATATLTTVAFTKKVCQRHTRVFGTRGELEGDGNDTIEWFDFASRTTQTIKLNTAPPSTRMSGHGGADYHLARLFVDAVRKRDSSLILSGPDETLESHMIVFAAEAARRAGCVISVPTAVTHGLTAAVLEAKNWGFKPTASNASAAASNGSTDPVSVLPRELAALLKRLETGPSSTPIAPLGVALPPETVVPISAATVVPSAMAAILTSTTTTLTGKTTALPACAGGSASGRSHGGGVSASGLIARFHERETGVAHSRSASSPSQASAVSECLNASLAAKPFTATTTTYSSSSSSSSPLPAGRATSPHVSGSLPRSGVIDFSTPPPPEHPHSAPRHEMSDSVALLGSAGHTGHDAGTATAASARAIGTSSPFALISGREDVSATMALQLAGSHPQQDDDDDEDEDEDVAPGATASDSIRASQMHHSSPIRSPVATILSSASAAASCSSSSSSSSYRR